MNEEEKAARLNGMRQRARTRGKEFREALTHIQRGSAPESFMSFDDGPSSEHDLNVVERQG